jgi:tetratricopeptide (TPR) repeat protein
LGAIYAQTRVLQEGFEQVAQMMMQQQKVLKQIADVLCHPYETKVLELLREADHALKQGMTSTGRDQKAEFGDATKLLNGVLKNPMGRRNYVAWFQVGWLKWKYELNIVEAEEAFYQASRLSAPKADLYHANSLKHMAYMQYLQKNHSDAYDTIQKAVNVLPDDHDIRYDAARYAAKAGREAEALELLERCIDQQPQTIVVMFSEEDFLQ